MPRINAKGIKNGAYKGIVLRPILANRNIKPGILVTKEHFQPLKES